jgi:hypothetical protein
MKIIHHEGRPSTALRAGYGTRRNSEGFTSWTFVPFVVSGFVDAD